jgi:hypothetical protein
MAVRVGPAAGAFAASPLDGAVAGSAGAGAAPPSGLSSDFEQAEATARTRRDDTTARRWLILILPVTAT